MYKIIGADGKEYGPVTADQIRRWMTEGRVNAQTRVRLEGSTDWKPLTEYPEFATTEGISTPTGFAGAAPVAGAALTDASDKVNGPAIGLIVVAALNFLASCGSLLFGVAGRSFFQGAEIPEETWAMFSGTLAVLSNLLSLALSGLILYGALQMKRLGSYAMAMTAAILAAVPCTSPCCLVGLPVGIWALVVLNKPEVKSAFKS